MTFREFLKQKRIASNLTLREFCRRSDEDPANYSRIERGVAQAPNEKTVARYAQTLRLSDDETRTFKALALASRRELPAGIPEDVLAAHLPIMLCTIDGSIPTAEQARNALDYMGEILDK